MRAITIKRFSGMPGRFQVTQDGPGMRYVIQRDAKDAGEAAAIAIEYGLQFAGRYVITGPAEVMAFIPAELTLGDGA